MRQYLDLLRRILDSGVKKEDRTGVGTISVFGEQLKFDLSRGFPAVTTKKLWMKGVVHELLWMLRGDTNIKYLTDNGVHIWDQWADENGDLNNVYGSQWRRWEHSSDNVCKIRIKEPENSGDFVTPAFQQHLTPNYNIKDDLIGKRFLNKRGLGYTVIDKIYNKGEKNSKYKVQFDTGYSYIVSRPQIRYNQVYYPYDKTIANVGCMGEPESNKNERLYNLWRSMLVRCYDKSHQSYKNYGAKGITVSKNWKCFSIFKKEITQVPYYNSWLNNPKQFDLDKDYYGAKQYSKSTCIFLDKQYNVGLANFVEPFSCDGEIFISMLDCALKYRIPPQRISDKLKYNKSSKYLRKHVIQKIPIDPGFVYRKERIIDQVKNVIDQIKTDPNSRRHIVSAWNVSEIDEMKLPPCHLMFQFYVSNEKLSCMFNMRSCDAAIGMPFNIASYALLTHMIAQVCGLEVGNLIVSLGDVHIYLNHVEQVREQLSRIPYDLPRLVLNPEIKNIDDFKFEDVSLEGYKYHPAIKMDIAV